MLAECILNDTDNFLRSLGKTSSRYVDDFRIVVSSDLDAHSVMCKLAEHLLVTEGLSLNVSKTKIQPLSDMHKSAKKRLEDAFTSKELLEIEEYIRINYGEDEDDEEDGPEPEDDASKPMFMTADNMLEKMKEISDNDFIDLSIYKAILRAMRYMPNVNLIRLLDEQSQLLYYIPREFCLLVRSALSVDDFQAAVVKDKILKLIRTPPFSDLSYVRAWALDLFVRGPLEPEGADFSDYDFSRSILERRYDLLLKGCLDDKAFFRSKRAKFSEISDWEKPAALIGAMCLPKDEYATWVDSISDEIPGPFSKIFSNWLKLSHGDLRNLLISSV